MQDFAGQRVTVMGLGRFGGGVGVTRFLVAQGADVLVTDTEPEARLADSIGRLADLPAGSVTYRLGGHNVSDFTTRDLVVANPAVKPGNRFLRAAEAAGIPVTTEIRLLVERLPNRRRTIGVTGTAGKSTVTAMIGHVLERLASGDWRREEGGAADPSDAKRQTPDAPPRVWIGGNLGGSLLPQLDQISEDDWVVLELSSFMLYHLREHSGMPGWSPHIAAVTNITPNHLDWHGTFEAYVADKRVILDNQQEGDIAVIADPNCGLSVRPGVRMVSVGCAVGTELVDLPGFHNQQNAGTAMCVVDEGVGIDSEVSLAALADFPGLPHRLQFVAEHNGVRFFNDSKCTTPEAARLAIESFDAGTVHVVLGGYDKGSDLAPLAGLAAARCAGVYTIGATGDGIADAAAAAAPQTPPRPQTCGGVAWPAPAAEVVRCGELDAAVLEAVKHAEPGQVVLLSPGCASWDQFENFEQRGNRFVELVLRYTTETGA